MKSNAKYRLSDSAYIEPLVNQWPAWSFLMSPIPASLHLVDYQLKVMADYLENPAVHVAASKDPALVAGPFMNIPVSRKDEIRTLLEETQKKQAGNLELARVFMEFSSRLAREAKGNSLEPYYARVPELLRGYVELVYDYHDRPSVRVLEKLLYESEFYDPTLQSFRFGLMKDDSSRTFILNTPRLLESNEIDWKLPFNSALADELFKLDLEPKGLDHVLDIMRGASVTAESILPFLSDEPTPKRATWNENRIRIRYFGHACVLIEWKGVSVLTDAYIPVHPLAGGVERFSFRDIPEKIDFVVITHNHQDHYVFESLLRLRQRIGCLVVPKSYGLLYGDLSLKILSQKLGFRNVVEMDTLDSIPLPDGEIIGMPFFGEHADLAHGKIAYVVRCGKEQMLFAADSDCLDRKMYERMRKAIGPVQTAFLSVENVGAPLSWVNGPLLPAQPRPEIEQQRRYHACDCERALEMMEALESKRLYSYAMGLEPWMEHLLGLNMSEDSEQWKQSLRVLAAARGRGFWTSERLFGSKTFHLDDPTGAVTEGTMDLRLRHWKQQLSEIQHFQLGAEARPIHGSGPQKSVQQLSLGDDVQEIIAGETQTRVAAFAIAAFLSSVCSWTDQEEFVLAFCMSDAKSIHYLPLRVDISGNPAFNALRSRVERIIAGALEYELPHETVQELARDIFKNDNRTCIRVGCVIQSGNEGQDEKHAPISANWSDLYDLEIQVHQAQVPDVGLEFNKSTLDETVAGQLAQNFSESMQEGIRDPSQHLSEISLALQAKLVSAMHETEAQFSF